MNLNSLNDSQPKIGVVVVNWNRKQDTLECIKSVLRSDYNSYELMVVDNASSDGSPQAIEKAYPTVNLKQNASNLGYTGGNNQGISDFLRRGFDYVFLLNNDAVIAPDTLSILAAAAVENPQAGFLGPKVYIKGSDYLILTAGGRLVNGWMPVQRGIGEPDRGQYDKVEEVDYLSGSAVMASRKAIEAIGLLDEEYFSYNEDMDWGYRGRKAGFQNLFIPAAKAWHPDTRSRDLNSAPVTYYIDRNCLLFIKKNGLGSGITTRVFLSYLRTYLSWSIRPKWRSKNLQRAALGLALRDFSLGRTGKMGPDVTKICYR